MPYPRDVPTNKHDLVGPDVQSANGDGKGVISENKFSSTSKLFEQLEKGNPSHVSKIAAVYTYPDSPSIPGPLSRGLLICGFADTSLSIVRKLISDDFVPPCLQKCTVAVKLADSAHVSQLKELDVANSHRFANLMKLLKKEDAVAILGRDKHNRFSILCPMDNDVSSSSEYTAEDFAAICYVGNVQEVKEYLAGGGSSQPVEASAPLWQPPSDEQTENSAPLWQPPGDEQEEDAAPLWQPPSTHEDGTAFGGGETSGGLWQPPSTDDGSGDAEGFSSWDPPSTDGQSVGGKRKRTDSYAEDSANGEFHADTGAAAADRFYSGLKRDLGTRADSRLYHMRSFNGWVKATQIQELDPKTQHGKGKRGNGPLRVLDLACGKGGDLGKWVLHHRGISNYVGIDVARGSLLDAAVRARKMRNKLKRCTFTCADLGADVPGRPKSPRHKQLQKLLTWSLQSESEFESQDPVFEMIGGGGISTEDKFDVVSIQFAIHYMMSSRTRARRFFQTVSQLLEVGGNLIATTIDAREVLKRLMNLGADMHFDNDTGNGSNEFVVTAGDGACRIQFEKDTVRRIFQTGGSDEEDLFGLQYTFTLVEGSDHAAGVGDAVNLPEWLTPIPALKSLASEAGLELEYAQNFHEFYAARQDPQSFPTAHNALYNMKVLDRHGSLSKDEWDVSRLYAAVKFRKVQESRIVLDDASAEEEEEEEATPKPTASQKDIDPSPPAAMTSKLLPMAMMKAKRAVGEVQWQSLSSDEKKHLTQIELEKMTKP